MSAVMFRSPQRLTDIRLYERFYTRKHWLRKKWDLYMSFSAGSCETYLGTYTSQLDVSNALAEIDGLLKSSRSGRN